MTWQYNDGGRKAAGFHRAAKGDCVVRAIAIATGIGYGDVFCELHHAQEEYRERHNDGWARCIGRRGATPNIGVVAPVYRQYLADRGWEFVPTMGFGTGCRVHLRADELPRGRIIARVTRHLSAVIDGVIHDAYDPSRHGTRCVYGYWQEAR